MKNALVVMFCLVSVLCAGCGATVRSSQGGMVRQTVYVTNAKGDAIAGTKVYVNGKSVGSTDEYGSLRYDLPGPSKGDSFKLKVQKNGFRSVTREVKAVVDGGFVTGDVFVGLLTGVLPIVIALAVDGGTDSWLAYPRSMQIVMDKRKK